MGRMMVNKKSVVMQSYAEVQFKPVASVPVWYIFHESEVLVSITLDPVAGPLITTEHLCVDESSPRLQRLIFKAVSQLIVIQPRSPN